MKDIPPRKFWQFHLSTAVLLALVGGGLVCLNSVNAVERIGIESEYQDYYETATRRNSQGWPYSFRYYPSQWDSDVEIIRQNVGVHWKLASLWKDLAFAGIILFGVMFVSEYFIRRHEGRKS